jgi:hypothetical protein
MLHHNLGFKDSLALCTLYIICSSVNYISLGCFFVILGIYHGCQGNPSMPGDPAQVPNDETGAHYQQPMGWGACSAPNLDT